MGTRRFGRWLAASALVLTAACGGDTSSPVAPSTEPSSLGLAVEQSTECALDGGAGCFSPTLTEGIDGSIQSAVSAPISLQGSVSGSTINLSWTKPGSGTPTSYVIEAGSSSGSSDRARIDTGSTKTTFTAQNVGSGTYYIRVRGKDSSGTGPASNEIKLVVGGGGGGGGSCSSAPNAPQSLSGSVSGTTVSLKWNPPSGGCAPTGYQLRAGSSSGSSNVGTFNLGNVTTFNANAGTGTYYLRVHGTNSNGTGPASNEVKLIVGSGSGGSGGCSSAPNAPQNLSGSVSGSTISLKWGAPSGGCAPTGYQLRAGSSSGSSNVGTFNLGNTTTFKADAPGGTYYLRIHGTNGSGTGPASNEVKLVVGGSGGGGGGGSLSVTKFLAFGDSLTEGTLALSAPDYQLIPISSSGGYPAKLRSLLSGAYPGQGTSVANGGKGGERCVAANSRLSSAISAANPGAVLIMHCANDLNRNDLSSSSIVSTALNGLRNLVRNARGRGLPVLLGSLPPQKQGGFRADGYPYLPSFNSGVRSIASSEGATYVDVFGALNSNVSRYIGSDGLHPTLAGYDRIGEAFFNGIRGRFQRLDEPGLEDEEGPPAGWEIILVGDGSETGEPAGQLIPIDPVDP